MKIAIYDDYRNIPKNCTNQIIMMVVHLNANIVLFISQPHHTVDRQNVVALLRKHGFKVRKAKQKTRQSFHLNTFSSMYFKLKFNTVMVLE